MEKIYLSKVVSKICKHVLGCKNNKIKIIFFGLITSIGVHGQNLIVNPDAELDPTTNGL